MSSHDDPEERIRELERSLGDRAAELKQSSTETGSAQYGGYPDGSAVPPLTPYTAPPSYGFPFPAVPTPPSRGIRPGWLVVGVLTMIAVGVVAGAVAFFSTMFSSVNSLIDIPTNGPTIPGGGGTFGQPPSRSGANRPQITIAEPTASRAPQGGDISVSGVGENKTIECNESTVNVSGVTNTVVLLGHCTSVTVSGVENTITIEAADTISTSGFDNRVTYRSGSPDIQNSGGSNVVERG